MKLRTALAAVLLLCARAGFAQNLGRYQTCQLQTVQGQAVPGAQVYFLTQPANVAKLTPQAQVYSAASGGAIAQPLLTNGFGECAAYLAPGVYTVVYVSEVAGTLVYPDQNVAVGGGAPTAPAFGAITSGTNTSSAMVVGSGASLTPSGSGVVDASMVDGVTVTGTPSSGQAIVATSPTAASWQTVSSGGSTAPAQQYDIPYYSASGTASALAGAAVNGLVKGRSGGAPVAATSIDVGNVLQGAANCTTAGQVYSPQSNSCVALSGLAAPGANGDLLYNNAGVVGAAAATTDASGNLSANGLTVPGGTNLNTILLSNSLADPLVVASGITTGYQQGFRLADASGDGLILGNDATHSQSLAGALKNLNIVSDAFTGNGPHSVSISNGSVVAASFSQEGGFGTTRLNKVYLQLNPSANCFSADSSGLLFSGCNPSQLESATWESPPVAGYGSTTARPVNATTGTFVSASFNPTSTSGNSIFVNSASTGSNEFTVPVYVRGAGGANDYNAAYVVDNGNPALNGGMGFPGPSSQPLISNKLNFFSGTGITMQLDNGAPQGPGCFYVVDGENNWNLFSICGNNNVSPSVSTTTIPGTLNGNKAAFSSLTSGNCVQASTGGLLTTTGSPCGSGGGSTAFSGLTSGMNNGATMLVGTGASLGTAGSGTINASSLLGSTWTSPPVIGATSPNSGYFNGLLLTGSETLEPVGTATSGGNFGSEGLQMVDSYWNGTAASQGLWQLQALPAMGTNPSDTLEVLYSGSPAGGTVQVPALQVLNVTNPTQCAQLILGFLSGTGVPCGSGGGGGTVLQTNGTNNTSQTAVNFITSTVNATGLTITPSNPASSSEKFELTGTINAANVATLNQNTTGSAATLTTARTLAGNSFNGSANVSFANKFIVQGTTDSGLSGAQFLGALGTGLLKNTTTTGVLSIATAGTDYFVSPMTTLGDILYENATPAAARLGGNTTATKNFLCQTGTGSVSAAPVWCTIATGDLPVATTGAAGAVKPDGTTITISSGVISVASIANITVTIGTSAIAANACDAGHTATMTGVSTAMTFSVTPTTDVSAVTGWGPGTPGLYLQPWPTANTFNYKVCNSSASSITPGASVTFNVSAR